jgi:hypothetical protein
MATKLAMTVSVKAIDSQRWICRTHWLHFNVTHSLLGHEPRPAHGILASSSTSFPPIIFQP